MLLYLVMITNWFNTCCNKGLFHSSRITATRNINSRRKCKNCCFMLVTDTIFSKYVCKPKEPA